MVLPTEVGDAAQDTDHDRVMAWLDAGGSINDKDNDKDNGGFTLVHCCVYGSRPDMVVYDQHVTLARHLIALGADVNVGTGVGYTPLHEIVQKDGERQAVLDMMSLLLGAGANVNAMFSEGETPLCNAIRHAAKSPDSAIRSAVITELLRAGASLDACHDHDTAEEIMENQEFDMDLAENEDWCAIKRRIAGVRKYGTYKKYMRAPHREVLACRGLVVRGYLAPTGTRRPRGPHKWKAAVTFLAKQGDNGIVWNILSYWRATH